LLVSLYGHNKDADTVATAATEVQPLAAIQKDTQIEFDPNALPGHEGQPQESDGMSMSTAAQTTGTTRIRFQETREDLANANSKLAQQFLANIPPELQTKFKAMANKGAEDDETPEEERPNPDTESAITFHTTEAGNEDTQDIEMTDKQMDAVPKASTTVHTAGSGVDT
jgi:hypothetical protein